MEIEWSLAHPLHDVEDIVNMADNIFGEEVEDILTTERYIFRKNVTVASTVQIFDRSKEFLAVARDVSPEMGIRTKRLDKDIDGIEEIPVGIKNKLLGFCWFDRYGYTTYSNEEISNAKFHHVDLALPAKTRVKLINAMIDQHILWAYQNGIPVVCSTSIRSDHSGFMRIHEKRGFKVSGSYAWIRTKEGLNGIKGIEIANN